MLSDAYMTRVFYKTGRSGTANAMLGLVGGNLGFQLIVLYVQMRNRKKYKWRTILFEFLTIVTFLKPGESSRIAAPPPAPLLT